MSGYEKLRAPLLSGPPLGEAVKDTQQQSSQINRGIMAPVYTAELNVAGTDPGIPVPAGPSSIYGQTTVMINNFVYPLKRPLAYSVAAFARTDSPATNPCGGTGRLGLQVGIWWKAYNPDGSLAGQDWWVTDPIAVFIGGVYTTGPYKADGQTPFTAWPKPKASYTTQMIVDTPALFGGADPNMPLRWDFAAQWGMADTVNPTSGTVNCGPALGALTLSSVRLMVVPI